MQRCSRLDRGFYQVGYLKASVGLRCILEIQQSLAPSMLAFVGILTFSLEDCTGQGINLISIDSRPHTIMQSCQGLVPFDLSIEARCIMYRSGVQLCQTSRILCIVLTFKTIEYPCLKSALPPGPWSGLQMAIGYWMNTCLISRQSLERPSSV